MCPQLNAVPPVPNNTARVAHAAFRNANLLTTTAHIIELCSEAKMTSSQARTGSRLVNLGISP